MSGRAGTLRVGAATATILNVGDSLWSLAEMFETSGLEGPGVSDGTLPASSLFPSQCVHIALDGASILVDAGCYDFAPESPQRPPGYVPPPDISAQLTSIGVRSDAITHFIISHLHADHYNAATIQRDDLWAPRFPNARCYIGRSGWEDAELQQELRDPHSMVSRTLGVLAQAHLIDLVEGDRDVLPGVRLIAAPGEAPEHQLVQLQSQGETLYCLGDLYHHPLEVEHPAWMCEWCDRRANLASRHALVARALAENAVLVAAHISGAGRLEQRQEGGVRWLSV